ncbi:[acyl-carrier-protein] S-malonyltransferase [Chitinivorax tropicus]|uniref:Malonyl CoA-acyl carrier protein transacylase n=1 Tax=Chitinivorax tropicus TaxID=714531 RepID=A0A840MJG7_9PROT|nr:[acyl-carrier-protein] S-malonyltransferase [Chitinivorax tropicus]
MSTAFVFPGQGSQSVGMLNGFADLPVVKETIDEANAVLGFDLWALIEAGPQESLNLTINTQPAMLAAGVATYRAWLSIGGQAPQWLAGHSLGEYTALVVAGALGYADALRLVRFRAQAMQEAVTEGEGAMAAVLGLDDALIVEACVAAAQGQVLEAVNFNSPGQVVIAGDKAAVERGMAACQERGAKRTMLLPVSVPSHCALMKPAAERLAVELSGIAISAPTIPVIHNVDVASHESTDKIKEALTRQLYSPVRWVETIQYMVAQGVTRVVECGPGKVLTGLNKRIDPNAKGIALVDTASVQSLLIA